LLVHKNGIHSFESTEVATTATALSVSYASHLTR